MKRCDLPRSLLRRIDTRALDEAVRRFPTMLATFNERPVKELPPYFTEAIVREYHLVVAERDRSATLRLR